MLCQQFTIDPSLLDRRLSAFFFIDFKPVQYLFVTIDGLVQENVLANSLFSKASVHNKKQMYGGAALSSRNLTRFWISQAISTS